MITQSYFFIMLFSCLGVICVQSVAILVLAYLISDSIEEIKNKYMGDKDYD